MKTPFSLDQHKRRARQPLSSPPAGYFERLPMQVMARVAAPPTRQPWALAWLLRAPAALRTGLASTLLLGTFATSLWLGSSAPTATSAASLDAVPREQLVDYLLSGGDAHLDLNDLAELPHRPLGLTRQYLRPTAGELNDALDAQPTPDDNLML